MSEHRFVVSADIGRRILRTGGGLSLHPVKDHGNVMHEDADENNRQDGQTEDIAFFQGHFIVKCFSLSAVSAAFHGAGDLPGIPENSRNERSGHETDVSYRRFRDHESS